MPEDFYKRFFTFLFFYQSGPHRLDGFGAYLRWKPPLIMPPEGSAARPLQVEIYLGNVREYALFTQYTI
jgi:hypothetical protein